MVRKKTSKTFQHRPLEILAESATEEEETKFKDILKDIRESVKIAKDACVGKDKASKEKFIQLFLAEANFILDTAMDLAKNDQIAFSFQGLESNFDDADPKLVHPDTVRADELEAQRDSGDWDSSSASCPGY